MIGSLITNIIFARLNEFVRVPVNNIVHFRLGLDDQDMRLGLSPLKALIREIATDTEADKYTAALLKNYAMPGLVVIPAGGTILDEPTADRITARFTGKFSGDNVGKVAVLSRETTVQPFGFSPKHLEMTALHRIPEERILACRRRRGGVSVICEPCTVASSSLPGQCALSPPVVDFLPPLSFFLWLISTTRSQEEGADRCRACMCQTLTP